MWWLIGPFKVALYASCLLAKAKGSCDPFVSGELSQFTVSQLQLVLGLP